MERGEPFVMLPYSLLDGTISHGAVVLYAHVLRYAGANETCWPSVSTLCRELGGTHRNTVSGYLRELKSRGLIDITYDRGRGTNVYTVRGTRPSDHAQHTVHAHPAVHDHAHSTVHDPTPPGGACTSECAEHAQPVVHRSIYSEVDNSLSVSTDHAQQDGPGQNTQGLTDHGEPATITPQVREVLETLGLERNGPTVGALGTLLAGEKGETCKQLGIDPADQARRMILWRATKAEQRPISVLGFSLWLDRAISYAQAHCPPEQMVPKKTPQTQPRRTLPIGETREQRLARQYPKWSPEADRDWRYRSNRGLTQVGEVPIWLT